MRRGGSRWRARDDGALTPRRGGGDVGVASARTFEGAAIATVCAAFGSAGFAFGIGGGGSGVTGGSGGGEGDFARMRTSRTGSSMLKSVESECWTGSNAGGAIGDDPSAANAIGYGAGGGGGGANEKPNSGPLAGAAIERVRGNPELVGP